MSKRIFGFQKVRYRGMAKNLRRLEVTAALAGRFMQLSTSVPAETRVAARLNRHPIEWLLLRIIRASRNVTAA